jgi:hypothetical protein
MLKSNVDIADNQLQRKTIHSSAHKTMSTLSASDIRSVLNQFDQKIRQGIRDGNVLIVMSMGKKAIVSVFVVNITRSDSLYNQG